MTDNVVRLPRPGIEREQAADQEVAIIMALIASSDACA